MAAVIVVAQVQGRPGPPGAPGPSGVPGLEGTGTVLTVSANEIRYVGNGSQEEIVKWRLSGPIGATQWDVTLYTLAENQVRDFDQKILMYSADGSVVARFVVEALARRIGSGNAEVVWTNTRVDFRSDPSINAWIHASGTAVTLSFIGLAATPLAVSYRNGSTRCR